MPPATVDVVKAIYAAWNAGDWGLEQIDPQIEWEVTALDQSGPMRGRDSLLRYWRRFWVAWERGARWEIEEVLPLEEEQVLCCGRLHVTGRSSGLEMTTPVFHLWTVRDGRLARLRVCDDRASALRAADE